MYKTNDIETIFNISHQTVKTWAAEFAGYLSPTATPEKGRQRVFTDDDLRVFALVSVFRKQGKTYEDMHAALRTGQRGDMPDVPEPSTLPANASGAVTAALRRVADLEAQLRQEHDARMMTEGENRLLKQMLKEANEELARLRSGN